MSVSAKEQTLSELDKHVSFDSSFVESNEQILSELDKHVFSDSSSFVEVEEQIASDEAKK